MDGPGQQLAGGTAWREVYPGAGAFLSAMRVRVCACDRDLGVKQHEGQPGVVSIHG